MMDVYNERGKDERMTHALDDMMTGLRATAAGHNVDQVQLCMLFIQACISLMRAQYPSPEWRENTIQAINKALDEGDALRATPKDTHEAPSAVQ